MTTELSVKQTGRRAMLRNCATLAGGTFLAQLFPGRFAVVLRRLLRSRGGSGG